MCDSPHGVKVLLSLLTSGEKHLPPHAHALLRPPERTVTVSAASEAGTPAPAAAGTAAEPMASSAMDTDDQDKPATSVVVLGASKKDAEARRKEMLGSGAGSLSDAVLAHCVGNVGALLRTAQGAELVAELACGSGHQLWDSSRAQVQALHGAIASAAHDTSSAMVTDTAEAAEAASDAAKPDSLVSNFFASRALRRMAQGGGCNADAAAAFRAELWQSGLQGQCAALVDSHGAKILAAVWEAGNEPLRSAIAAELAAKAGIQDVASWNATFQRAPKVTGKGTKGTPLSAKVALQVDASA